MKVHMNLSADLLRLTPRPDATAVALPLMAQMFASAAPLVDREREGPEYLDVALPEIYAGRRARMGWVEYELRRPSRVMTSAAHRVWQGARANLRRSGMTPESLDIASEAIEAAEALSL